MGKDVVCFVKASISSLSNACVDFDMFFLIFHNRNQLIIIALATIISRCISATVNFIINKYRTFLFSYFVLLKLSNCIKIRKSIFKYKKQNL